MTDHRDTDDDDLLTAAAIGKRNGLRFVYAGNRPGRVGALEHTRCPACGQILVERFGYHINAYRVTPKGACGDVRHGDSGPMGSGIRRAAHRSTDAVAASRLTTLIGGQQFIRLACASRGGGCFFSELSETSG